MRAKARLAAGMHEGARQGRSRRLWPAPAPASTASLTASRVPPDLLATLELQPQNAEAEALMEQHVLKPGQVRPPLLPLSIRHRFSLQRRGRPTYACRPHPHPHPPLPLPPALRWPDTPMPHSLVVKSLVRPHTTPRFSTEIWREVALWLPPRDLKSLLAVPHVLSRIASELLFQRIDLHLCELAPAPASPGPATM